jgi:hypothetical protein
MKKVSGVRVKKVSGVRFQVSAKNWFQVSGVRDGLRITVGMSKIHGTWELKLINLICKFGHDASTLCSMPFTLSRKPLLLGFQHYRRQQPVTGDQKLTPET